jgi:hypothetical protein
MYPGYGKSICGHSKYIVGHGTSVLGHGTYPLVSHSGHDTIFQDMVKAYMYSYIVSIYMDVGTSHLSRETLMGHSPCLGIISTCYGYLYQFQ